ncbi:hypothetical protein ACFE04_031515 [Oxalis oulophora]
MSQSVHLIAGNFPGFAPSSHGGSSSSSRIHSQIKTGSLKCTTKGFSFVCQANSSGGGGHRRNPDFSRHNNNNNNNNRNSFSRNRNNNNNYNNNNRQSEHRDRYENHDDSEILSSKNGPLLSLSGSPKSQATAAPGPREKEIVELFRKVQAQLRERAATKGKEKTELSKPLKVAKEAETVDSLLKLLRKHSVEQDKKKENSTLSFDKPEQDGPDDEDKISDILSSNNRVEDRVPESKPSSSLSRPPSSFRRKSPVPQVKYQPEYSDLTEKVEEDQVDSPEIEPILAEVELEPDVELGLEPDVEMGLEPELDINAESAIVDENVTVDEWDSDDPDSDEWIMEKDLSALKLAGLRAIAKTKGLKGYSKMKKSELVELLKKKIFIVENE